MSAGQRSAILINNRNDELSDGIQLMSKDKKINGNSDKLDNVGEDDDDESEAKINPYNIEAAESTSIRLKDKKLRKSYESKKNRIRKNDKRKPKKN